MATYALIHGAADSGAAWGRVASELEARGHRAVAPDLPCDDESAGWEEHVDAVREAVGDAGDLRVVGHSLGGFTAALVCARMEAESLDVRRRDGPRARRDARGVLRPTRPPESPTTRSRPSWPTCPREQADAALAAARPQVARAMGEPLPIDAVARRAHPLPALPRRQLLPGRLDPRRWCATGWASRPTRSTAAHCPFLSRPGDLAAYLA